MQFPRLAVLAVIVASFLFNGRTALAQGNILSLCTEAELISLPFAQGGEWTIDCVSNRVTIPITSPIIADRDVTIRTIGTNEVILNGSNITRILIIRPNVTVTLSGFVFTNGRQTSTNENNGGIDVTAGGAIYNDRGTLQMLGGRFSNNSVIGVTGGNGEDTTGQSGEHGGDAAGAAIYNNEGIILVSNVVFNANSLTAGAGGKGGSSQTGGFGGSGGNGGNGGSSAGAAIYANGGTNDIYLCTFTDNTAAGAAAGAGGATSALLGAPGRPGEPGKGYGGAIAAAKTEPPDLPTALSIWGCTFSGNNVRGANGLAGNAGVGRNNGDEGRTGGEANGGAVYSDGKLKITNSTFFRNSAVSGNGGAGGAGSSDGFGFDGGEGGSGGLASGGAVDSRGAGSDIVHCTFSDNTVTGGSGGAGGQGSGLGEDGDSGSRGAALGGAVHGASQHVFIANSILANSPMTLGGLVTDLGGNIATDTNVIIKTNISWRLTNPLLQPLANNGGPTMTMAIRSNSPAINKGFSAYCVVLDQRGTNRVGGCDIGAFEYIPPAQVIPPEVTGTNGLVLQTTSSNTFRLRWPAGYTNLYLQGATNLAGTNTLWTTITNFNTSNTNFNFLDLTPQLGLPYTFYRLFSPNAGRTSATVEVPFPPFPRAPQPPQPPQLPGTTSTDDSLGAESDSDTPRLPEEPDDSTGGPPQLPALPGT
ncbi:MAG TPA: choice-of-anchor Q domain-containing protein [Verrucomicrobiae bacterium]